MIRQPSEFYENYSPGADTTSHADYRKHGDSMPNPAMDPRVEAGARTLANRMGTPKDWRVWAVDVKAVVEAADRIDPLRKETAK